MLVFSWQLILFCLFCIVALIQLCYYLILFRRVAFYQPVAKTITRQHPVTVIVCARDEAPNLALNLPGVLVQTYPSTHEVIVVNDNSFDESKYLLEGIQKTFKHLQVVELTQEALMIPGKKYPLSIGIKSAKHEVLLMTDADCVPASEFWMNKMQDGYDDNTEIVLGYGAYHKKSGFLNKLIRFETVHTAMQYFSYALAGMPYMGVGRNLSYRKAIFFRHKGFSAHNHLPSGDDDLFINMAATKDNTRIVLDPDAFTLSTPAATWKEWIQQKRRHYSTGKYYKPRHKFLLGLYALSHFLFYPLLVTSAVFYDWRLSASVFALRFLVQSVIYYKTMKKLQEPDLWPWLLLMDTWFFFYYLIFAPALWKRPKQSWK
jgi:cellulose synthase/poly-beta-1,6-N-acetylglucosamine synthase-like glycosyltransferase